MLPTELAKKLVSIFPPANSSDDSRKRASVDAANAISELLRIFLIDAHRRASIEAECDEDIKSLPEQFKHKDVNEDNETRPSIGSEHITRICGDLLMDYS